MAVGRQMRLAAFLQRVLRKSPITVAEQGDHAEIPPFLGYQEMDHALVVAVSKKSGGVDGIVIDGAGKTVTIQNMGTLQIDGAISATGMLLKPPMAGPLNPPRGAWVRWLPLPDWS